MQTGSQQICLHGDVIAHTWSAERTPKKRPEYASQFQQWRFTENSSRRRSVTPAAKPSGLIEWGMSLLSDCISSSLRSPTEMQGRGSDREVNQLKNWLHLVSSTHLNVNEIMLKYDLQVGLFKRVIWDESDTLCCEHSKRQRIIQMYFCDVVFQRPCTLLKSREPREWVCLW